MSRKVRSFPIEAKYQKYQALMIDNYDSFTYNLVQYFQQLGVAVETVRNDFISVEEAMAKSWDFCILSPGPSDPDHSGICLDLVKAVSLAKRPLLGICLGHQSIGQVFGGDIYRIHPPVHGKVHAIHVKESRLFRDIPDGFLATRYHSLAVRTDNLPKKLRTTAVSEDQICQALEHDELPIAGIQFHPESILTEYGHKILSNFIDAFVDK